MKSMVIECFQSPLYTFFEIEFFAQHYWKKEFKTANLSDTTSLNSEKITELQAVQILNQHFN